MSAYEGGYYDVPRGATADELSTELGVSHQAVSKRLRRAHGPLIQTALELGAPDGDVSSQESDQQSETGRSDD